MNTVSTITNEAIIITEAKSRGRLQQERKAIALFDQTLSIADTKRIDFVKKIRAALRPTIEAKKLAKQELMRRRKGGVKTSRETGEPLDFSDVLELECKLLRKDRYLDPHQVITLRSMNTRIAKGAITRTEFDKEAEALLRHTLH